MECYLVIYRERSYSAFEHLAKTVLLGKWRDGVWVLMSVAAPSSAYFDESRLNDNFPVVAGFWNPVDLWIVCEEQLRRALRHKPPNLAAKKYVRGHPLEFARILNTF